MKGRFIPLIAALAAGLVLVAPSAAAPPAGASVTIGHQATLVTLTQILVPVAAECPAGVQASFNVTVSQQNTLGPNTNGIGFSPSFTCTGNRQHFSIIVSAGSGTWTPGSAFANAVLFSGLNHRVENSRVIAIS
jgi:hypothetical protein